MNHRNLVAAASILTALASVPAEVAAQNRVAIEPVGANIDRQWLYEIKESRGKARAVTEHDARRIATDMAASLQRELDRALRAEGFDVVPAAEAGVVRVAARIDNLYVNAAEVSSVGVKSFTREAGRATLHAEARNAVGAVVLQSEERAHAGDTGGLRYTTDVSNRFWFDAIFRDWSVALARDLKAKAR